MKEKDLISLKEKKQIGPFWDANHGSTRMEVYHLQRNGSVTVEPKVAIG